jgi:hypothetical protein
MARNSPVSIKIYRRHIQLYRYLNDAWTFTQLVRPLLKERADTLRASRSKIKRRYPVPKKGKLVDSMRRDEDIGQVFWAQYERGVFETNIVNIVSRVEAFIQECLIIAVLQFPEKLGILAEKSGIPVDMFLDYQDRDELLARYVASRCEGLMFGRPSEYLARACKILAIELRKDTIDSYIEIKASRDIIIHNLGAINSQYVDKARTEARGNVGDELVIDRAYFKHVLITAKVLSGEIQSKVEAVYK